jgi:putative nucleotidyltransferase with HDIG domain
VALGPSAAARATLASVAGALDGPAWLAGGAVRDLLLGRPVRDLDLALPAGSVAAARRVADRLGGAFVALGEPHGMARVVLPGGDTVDLADLRAPTLEGDLGGRDVTVNALAVEVAALLAGPAPVLDPTGGLADLAARRLRACGSAAFADDPVRVLRTLRLAHELGFAVEPATAALARRAAPNLAAAAGERLREEVTRLLRLPATAPAVRDADAWGAVAPLLPEIEAMRASTQSAPHRFTVWEHSLRALAAADRLLAAPGVLAPHDGAVAAHLAEPLGSGLTRREVLKAAALLHDVAKPVTRAVDPDGRVRFTGHDRLGAERVAAFAGRLRWPARASGVLVRLVRHHLRPMHLGMLAAITPRARYRFHRDLGEEVPDLVCLALCDAAGTTGREPEAVYHGATRALLEGLLAGLAPAREEAAAPPLVRGGDVMDALGLPPGPEVGRLLARAREAQALGLVRTREEALRWLAGRAGPAAEGGAGDQPPA